MIGPGLDRLLAASAYDSFFRSDLGPFSSGPTRGGAPYGGLADDLRKATPSPTVGFRPTAATGPSVGRPVASSRPSGETGASAGSCPSGGPGTSAASCPSGGTRTSTGSAEPSAPASSAPETAPGRSGVSTPEAGVTPNGAMSSSGDRNGAGPSETATTAAETGGSGSGDAAHGDRRDGDRGNDARRGGDHPVPPVPASGRPLPDGRPDRDGRQDAGRLWEYFRPVTPDDIERGVGPGVSVVLDERALSGAARLLGGQDDVTGEPGGPTSDAADTATPSGALAGPGTGAVQGPNQVIVPDAGSSAPATSVAFDPLRSPAHRLVPPADRTGRDAPSGNDTGQAADQPEDEGHAPEAHA